MIVFAANEASRRDEVRKYLRAKKNENSKFTVVDLGGSANPWCGEFVDYYVDVVGDGEKLIKGDIHSLKTWEKVKQLDPDFCICTHTLEDIRDPGWVLARISEAFRGGFIAVPNKHQELTRGMESWSYPGWCHHRWIFSFQDDGILRAFPKFPVTVCFTSMRSLIGKIMCTPFLRKVACKLKIMPLPKKLSWVKRELSNRKYELSVMFEGNLPFEYINGDFAGENMEKLVAIYQDRLGEGL